MPGKLPIPIELSNLSDGALIKLHTDEWDSLTTQGQATLLKEMTKRKLNTHSPQPTEIVFHDFLDEQIPKNLLIFLEHAMIKSLSTQDVLAYLKQHGFTFESIKLATQKIELDLQNKQNNPANHITTGFAILVSGIAICSLPINRWQHPVTYILAYCLMIAGTFRMWHGWIKRQQQKRYLLYLKIWGEHLLSHPLSFWQVESEEDHQQESTPEIIYHLKKHTPKT